MIVEVWADVLCPFTHVGLTKLVARRDEIGSATQFRARAWPLERVNGAPLDPELVRSEISALQAVVSPDLFRAFDPLTFPKTSIGALALTAAAYESGLDTGERAALAVRAAVFEEGRDIGAPEVVADLARELGIAKDSVDPDRVDAEYAAGRRAGVVGSPYFVIGGRGYFCPSLDITHDASGFAVAFDATAFEDFATAALG